MSNFYKKLMAFFRLLGPSVRHLLAGAVTVGIFWFLVDSFFILILQAFLVSMNLVDVSKLNLPTWLPTNTLAASLLLVLFALFRGGVWACKHYFAASTSHVFMSVQRERILRLGLLSPFSESSSQLITAFGDHTLKAGHALFYLSHFLVASVAVIFFSLYATITAPVEFLMSFLILGLIFVPIKAFDKRVKKLATAITSERNLVTSTLLNGLKNKFFLKISGMVSREYQLGTESIHRAELHYRSFEKIAAIRSAIPICVGGTLVGLIYWISSNYIHTPSAKLLIFFYLLLRIAQSFSEIVSSGGEVQVNANGFLILIDLSNRLSKIQNSGEPFFEKSETSKSGTFTRKSVNEVLLRNVEFGFEEQLLFKGLTTKIKKSECLLILGESGSGKSTLLALIAGLIKPNGGEIQIDGDPSVDFFKNSSALIAYVGPEAFFIAGSVRENLLYGHPNPSAVSDDRIWEVLSLIGISSLISSLPGKLSEQLLDLVQLSTGQKQRMSIVRALLREPEILLLDEATANLDVKTEAAILQSIMPLMKNMITIIISHKDTFNSIANHTIRL